MRVLRAIAWVFAGGFVVGFAGVALGWIDPARLPLVGHLFEPRAGDVEPDPQPQPERAREPERADFDPPPMADPAPADPRPLPHCCVDRQHLGFATLVEIQDALALRWPELRRLQSDQIVAGDRVAFLIEVGTEPQTFDREVMTGVVMDADATELDVELDEFGACSHGWCRGDRRKIPRRAVLGWTRARDPQRRVVIDWKPKTDGDGLIVRHVEVGDPITLPLPDQRPGMRWSVEPAGSSFRVLDVRPDNLARVVFDRGSGRYTVRLLADDPGWQTALGHWAFEVG